MILTKKRNFNSWARKLLWTAPTPFEMKIRSQLMKNSKPKYSRGWSGSTGGVWNINRGYRSRSTKSRRLNRTWRIDFRSWYKIKWGRSREICRSQSNIIRKLALCIIAGQSRERNQVVQGRVALLSMSRKGRWSTTERDRRCCWRRSLGLDQENQEAGASTKACTPKINSVSRRHWRCSIHNTMMDTAKNIEMEETLTYSNLWRRKR